jgi:hypothetical protein
MDEYNIDHANNYPKDIYLDCNGIAVLNMLYNVKYVEFPIMGFELWWLKPLLTIFHLYGGG